MSTAATLVATPDAHCSCGFLPVRTRRGYQWVFRRDRACPVHRRGEVTTQAK